MKLKTGWFTTTRRHDVIYGVNEHAPYDVIMVSSEGRWTYFSGYPNRYGSNDTEPYEATSRDMQHAIKAVFAEWHRFK